MHENFLYFLFLTFFPELIVFFEIIKSMFFLNLLFLSLYFIFTLKQWMSQILKSNAQNDAYVYDIFFFNIGVYMLDFIGWSKVWKRCLKRVGGEWDNHAVCRLYNFPSKGKILRTLRWGICENHQSAPIFGVWWGQVYGQKFKWNPYCYPIFLYEGKMYVKKFTLNPKYYPSLVYREQV